MNHDLMTRLDALVEAERTALVTGELHQLGWILEEKQAIVETLPGLAADVEALRPLRARLERNRVLYDAALAGIRRVVERLGTLQDLRKALETYDAQGRRQTLPEMIEHKLEKRA